MSEPGAIFYKALVGCQHLQRAFPADVPLRKVIEQLQFWVDRAGASADVSARQASRMTRIDARSLKPLNEEVAGWVYDAAAVARRLTSAAPVAARAR